MDIAVTELHIYPVKSLAGIALQQCEMLPTGLEFDRCWMVVSPDGEFITQRSQPQMSLIGTAINDGQLVLSTFGMEDHSVPAADESMPRLATEVWGDRVAAVQITGDSSDWLSQALGTPCHLVSFPHDETRQCDPEHASEGDQTHFADGYPLLITSQASLDHLNGKLASPVGMDRFRPNIVVSGCGPHEEDDWGTININDIPVRMAKPCPRCSVPTVDPEAGVLAGPEPIHTLSSYRSRDGEIYFGMNAIPDGTWTIRVGDRVTF